MNRALVTYRNSWYLASHQSGLRWPRLQYEARLPLVLSRFSSLLSYYGMLQNLQVEDLKQNDMSVYVKSNVSEWKLAKPIQER